MFFQIKELIKIHSGELAVFGIATMILTAITILVTGDIGQVLAGRHKH